MGSRLPYLGVDIAWSRWWDDDSDGFKRYMDSTAREGVALDWSDKPFVVLKDFGICSKLTLSYFSLFFIWWLPKCFCEEPNCIYTPQKRQKCKSSWKKQFILGSNDRYRTEIHISVVTDTPTSVIPSAKVELLIVFHFWQIHPMA